MKAAKIGQIQTIIFITALFFPNMFFVWFCSLFFEDKEL